MEPRFTSDEEASSFYIASRHHALNSVSDKYKQPIDDRLNNLTYSNPDFMAMFSESQIAHIKLNNSKNYKNKPIRYINAKLSGAQQSRLIDSFPCFTLSFGDPNSAGSHVFARIHRRLSVDLFLRDFNYDPKRVLNAPYVAHFKDVGANPVSHLINDRFGAHCCSPNLCINDACRKARTNNHIRDVDKSGFTPERMSHYAAHARRDSRYVCSTVAEQCTVKAPVLLFVHSIYDIKIQAVAQMMFNADAKRAYGCFIYNSDILYKTEGYLPGIECNFRREMRAGRQVIKFSFPGDVQMGYEHDFYDYIELLKTFTISHTSDGVAYHYMVNFTSFRDDVMYFEVLANTEGHIQASYAFRDLYNESLNDQTIVYYWHMDTEVTTKLCRSALTKLRPTRLIIPTTLFYNLVSYAFTLGESKFNVKNLLIAATSFNSRLVVNGAAVRKGPNVDPFTLQKLAHAVYLLVYISNYECTKTQAALMKEEDRVRLSSEKSFASRVMMNLRSKCRKFLNGPEVAPLQDHEILSNAEDQINLDLVPKQGMIHRFVRQVLSLGDIKREKSVKYDCVLARFFTVSEEINALSQELDTSGRTFDDSGPFSESIRSLAYHSADPGDDSQIGHLCVDHYVTEPTCAFDHDPLFNRGDGHCVLQSVIATRMTNCFAVHDVINVLKTSSLISRLKESAALLEYFKRGNIHLEKSHYPPALDLLMLCSMVFGFSVCAHTPAILRFGNGPLHHFRLHDGHCEYLFVNHKLPETVSVSLATLRSRVEDNYVIPRFSTDEAHIMQHAPIRDLLGGDSESHLNKVARLIKDSYRFMDPVANGGSLEYVDVTGHVTSEAMVRLHSHREDCLSQTLTVGIGYAQLEAVLSTVSGLVSHVSTSVTTCVKQPLPDDRWTSYGRDIEDIHTGADRALCRVYDQILSNNPNGFSTVYVGTLPMKRHEFEINHTRYHSNIVRDLHFALSLCKVDGELIFHTSDLMSLQSFGIFTAIQQMFKTVTITYHSLSAHCLRMFSVKATGYSGDVTQRNALNTCLSVLFDNNVARSLCVLHEIMNRSILSTCQAIGKVMRQKVPIVPKLDDISRAESSAVQELMHNKYVRGQSLKSAGVAQNIGTRSRTLAAAVKEFASDGMFSYSKPFSAYATLEFHDHSISSTVNLSRVRKHLDSRSKSTLRSIFHPYGDLPDDPTLRSAADRNRQGQKPYVGFWPFRKPNPTYGIDTPKQSMQSIVSAGSPFKTSMHDAFNDYEVLAARAADNYNHHYGPSNMRSTDNALPPPSDDSSSDTAAPSKKDNDNDDRDDNEDKGNPAMLAFIEEMKGEDISGSFASETLAMLGPSLDSSASPDSDPFLSLINDVTGVGNLPETDPRVEIVTDPPPQAPEDKSETASYVTAKDVTITPEICAVVDLISNLRTTAKIGETLEQRTERELRVTEWANSIGFTLEEALEVGYEDVPVEYPSRLYPKVTVIDESEIPTRSFIEAVKPDFFSSNHPGKPRVREAPRLDPKPLPEIPSDSHYGKYETPKEVLECIEEYIKMNEVAHAAETENLSRVFERYVTGVNTYPKEVSPTLLRKNEISGNIADSKEFGIMTKHKKWLIVPGSKDMNVTEYKWCYDGESIRSFPIVGSEEHRSWVADGRPVVVNEYCKKALSGLTAENLRHYSGHFKRCDFKMSEINFVQAVPGAGKTTRILKKHVPFTWSKNGADASNVILCTTEGKDDFIRRAKPVLDYPKDADANTKHKAAVAAAKSARRHFRTMASILINSYLPQTLRSKSLFIDEAFMHHPGAIFAAIIICGASQIEIYGDTKQIPYVSRIASFDMRHGKLEDYLTPTEVMNMSYRCPTDTCKMLSPIYESSDLVPEGQKYGMVCSRNTATRSMSIKKYTSPDCLPNAREGLHFITFTQNCKKTVGAANSRPTNTCHEYEGKQSKDIVLVRETDSPADRLASDLSYIVVALSRHTESFTYYTKDTNDTISKMIKNFYDNNASYSSHFKDNCGAISFNDEYLGTANVMSCSDNYKAINCRDPRGKSHYNTLRFVEFRGDQISGPVLEHRVTSKGVAMYAIFPHSACMRDFRELIPSIRSVLIDNKIKSLDLHSSVLEKIEAIAIRSVFYKKIDKDLSLYRPLKESSEENDEIPYQVFDVLNRNAINDVANERELQLAQVRQPRLVSRELNTPDITLAELQLVVDHSFGQGAYVNQSIDSWQLHHYDLELNIEQIQLVPHRSPYEPEIYEKMRPNLRTPIPHLRVEFLEELLVALVKRNCNVPDVVGQVPINSVSDSMITALVRECFDNEKLAEVSRSPIGISPAEVASWLEKQPHDVLQQLDCELPLHSVALNEYYLSIKRCAKPSLKRDASDSYGALQTILYHEKFINAIFCPIFREIKERVHRCLRSNLKMFADVSPNKFEELLDRDIGNGEAFALFSGDDSLIYNGYEYLEIDISKYDKSQGCLALDYECKYMRLFGVSEEMIELWYNAHKETSARSRCTGVKIDIPFQRKSGDASTFLGNTLFLMGVLSYVVPFSHLMGADLNQYNDPQLYGMLFNLEVKYFRYEHPYFCSKFLIRTSSGWKLIADPVKLICKLGRHDLVNPSHVECYRISVHDHVKEFNNLDVCRAVSEAISERYYVQYDFTSILHKMPTISKSDVFPMFYDFPDSGEANMSRRDFTMND